MGDIWCDVVGRCAAAACVRRLVAGIYAGDMDKPMLHSILFSWGLCFVAEKVEGEEIP
jgi:hypothetical protein